MSSVLSPSISGSRRLEHVRYDIRGPIYEQAQRLEKEGHHILSLHIGNPAPFGFHTPDVIVQHITENLPLAQGYGDSRGLFEARQAIREYYQQHHVPGVQMEDVLVGNGVSELVLLSMQALLNEGDEILVPSPDYPLWTSAVHLHGGKAIHYHCEEASNWYPDAADIRRKITSRTKGIVVINPNNPTGAVYPAEVLQEIAQIAEENRLVIFSDEIYDQILYDDARHMSIASFVQDTLCLTFNGLTKNYRAPGYRAGWLVISGTKTEASHYLHGLNLLANLRVCGNVPVQYAIAPALNGHSGIGELTAPGGRLRQQRDICYEKISRISGLSCAKPAGAFYLFAKIDLPAFNLKDDFEFVFDLLTEEKVLVVQGKGFNHYTNDHFRVVFLPHVEELTLALDRVAAFLARRMK